MMRIRIGQISPTDTVDGVPCQSRTLRRQLDFDDDRTPAQERRSRRRRRYARILGVKRRAADR